MFNKSYYYGRLRSRKGDAICADYALYRHHKDMADIEIHGHSMRFCNIRPHRKDAVFDLLDAIKYEANKKGCTLMTYKGELDDARAEILKAYGFKELPACGLQRFFDLKIKEEADAEA